MDIESKTILYPKNVGYYSNVTLHVQGMVEEFEMRGKSKSQGNIGDIKIGSSGVSKKQREVWLFFVTNKHSDNKFGLGQSYIHDDETIESYKEFIKTVERELGMECVFEVTDQLREFRQKQGRSTIN